MDGVQKERNSFDLIRPSAPGQGSRPHLHHARATIDRNYLTVPQESGRVAAELPATTELRAFLRTRLPEYLVSAVFVGLPRLPLTPNGKLDRRALPAPPSERPTGTAYEPPRTPTEEVLATLWAELLGLDRVSRDDDFFELGGHSLLATQLASRIRHTFNLEVPLRTLFEHPTLARLATQIVDQGGTQDAPAGDSFDAILAAITDVERLSDTEISALLQQN